MGFLPPWSVFVGNLAAPERSYLTTLLAGLKGRYPRLVEPAAGSFAVASIARELGWDSASIETSDVSLYSSALGEAICGRDLASLGVCLDGKPLPLTGSPAQQAAEVLMTQLQLRVAKRKANRYLDALIEDYQLNRESHLTALATRIEALATKLGPISYRAMDGFAHLAEVAHDPEAVVVLNMPTYEKGYVVFFDTGGRLTWNEPPYTMFDPKEGVRQLLDSAADAAALVVVLQQTPHGHPSAEPTYARTSTRDESVYYLSNRPEEVRAAAGMRVRPRPPTRLERPPGPVIPPDHPITADSVCGVTKITAAQSAYLKELWVHRIKPGAGWTEWALVVDGYIAAISGYGMPPTGIMTSEYAAHAILLYTFAAPHPRRLLRLLVAMALQRDTLRACSTPSMALWSDSCTDIFTVMLTPHPEVKTLRGLMKQVQREKDPVHGYKLRYTAPIGTLTPAEVFASWWKKEMEWQKTTSASR